MTLPAARILHRKGHWSGPALACSLSYDGRFLRRKALACDGGERFLLDLAHTESLGAGDALELEDGRLVEIRAAAEPLLAVTGRDLPRLAWHVGNRHTPCQIEAARLLIQRDHVIRDMLRHLGAEVAEVTEPFTPEGGAYGHGRTHAHEHVHSTHTHSHAEAQTHTHADGTTHSHSHSHGHAHHDHDH
ncbi:urease accessory protein UreE [Aquicoccus sp. SCR17]|nr:urease accessory protein UreE [Carideicomes alvinocaridis]